MGQICKYCGDYIGSNNICVRCGASFPASNSNKSFSAGGGNAHPNSQLYSASDEIKSIQQNYQNEHARLKQEAREHFKQREREREESIAAKKRNKAGNGVDSDNNSKSNNAIWGRLGAGIVLGIIAGIFNPGLFFVGFIVGFILYKG